MPVRSLSSLLLQWPDRRTVHDAVTRWAGELAAQRADLERVGYFGSYARGDWGVGSDLDVVVVLRRSDIPFTRRALGIDATALPVPADVLVYTVAEWEGPDRPAFLNAVEAEAEWVFNGSGSRAGH